MNDLLTLSISETRSVNEFEVLTYCMRTKQYYPLVIPRENMFLDNQAAVWDLFQITRVNDVQKDPADVKGKLHRVLGNPEVVGRKSKREMKQFFESNKDIVKYVFSSNSNSDRRDYFIIKVEAILTIAAPEIVNDKTQSRVSFSPGNIKNILNKDYRWLGYWSRLKPEEIPWKIQWWQQYFYTCKNDIYLVIKKHPFDNRYVKWICGFHCI